jgi:hypothetical protein
MAGEKKSIVFAARNFSCSNVILEVQQFLNFSTKMINILKWLETCVYSPHSTYLCELGPNSSQSFPFLFHFSTARTQVFWTARSLSPFAAAECWIVSVLFGTNFQLASSYHSDGSQKLINEDRWRGWAVAVDTLVQITKTRLLTGKHSRQRGSGR